MTVLLIEEMTRKGPYLAKKSESQKPVDPRIWFGILLIPFVFLILQSGYLWVKTTFFLPAQTLEDENCDFSSQRNIDNELNRRCVEERERQS